MRIKPLLIIASCLLLALVAAAIALSVVANDASQKQSAADNTTAAIEFDLSNKSDTSITAAQNGLNDTIAPALTTLQKQLEPLLSKQDGSWAVFVAELDGDSQFAINNSKLKAASLIKLFVMATVYDSIENGSIKQTAEIDDLLFQMITVSHNESTNELVRQIGGGDFATGMQRVNSYCTKWGYTQTEIQRDLRDYRAVPIAEENWTSVTDCGKLLSAIYHGKCVSDMASAEMLKLLLQQTRTTKIPAGVPSGTVVANKTGELGDSENDVAIIYGPNCDYILCVMSSNLDDTKSARSAIVQLSTDVFNWFRDEYPR